MPSRCFVPFLWIQLMCCRFATGDVQTSLAADDECDSENCAVNALQLQKVQATSEALAEDLANSSGDLGFLCPIWL